MGKLNIIHIIKNHLKTFRRLGQQKVSKKDIFIFFFLPFLISGLLVYNSISINDIIGDLLKAIAIFSAFLFNMLAIVNGSMDKEKVKSDKIREIYAMEIHSNLSFEILIGIFLVFGLLIQSMILGMSIQYIHIFLMKKLIELINYTLLGIFLLTLIMCLNRVYILIKH